MIWCHAHKDFLRGRRDGSWDFEYRRRTDCRRYLIMMALELKNCKNQWSKSFKRKKQIRINAYTRDLDYLISCLVGVAIQPNGRAWPGWQLCRLKCALLRLSSAVPPSAVSWAWTVLPSECRISRAVSRRQHWRCYCNYPFLVGSKKGLAMISRVFFLEY